MHFSLLNQLAEDVEQFLGSPDGECGDHDAASATGSGFHNLRQARLIIILRMEAVAVSRLT